MRQANGFTDADLAMNRAGGIEAEQISPLIEQIVRPLVRSFLVLAGWLFVIMLAGWTITAGLHLSTPVRALTGPAFLKLFILFRGLYIVAFVRIGAVIMLISFLGPLTVAVITTIVKAIGLIRDGLAGQVAMCQGRVYVSEARPGRSA